MCDPLCRRGLVRLAGCLLLVTPLMLSGCPAEQPAAPPEAGPADSESESATDATTDEASAETSEPEMPAEAVETPAETPEPEPTPTPAESSSSTTEPAAPAEEPESASVVLGDESLYRGIPGDGTLTVEQVTAWLDTPGIHDALSVTLPLGLSLGAKQITGIEENPMTRAKIELGRQLYFDGRLSSDGTISCASCHAPDQGYAAHTQFGVGVGGQKGGRNSPVSFNRILSGAQFWDGRAESLEAQAVGPIANAIEMSNTHEAVVETLGNIEGYRIQFERVFGENSVNIDNVGKAIATFERAIVTGPSPYDYYAELKKFVDAYPTDEDLADLKDDAPEDYANYKQAKADSEAHAMSQSALHGMELFFSDKVGCTACHVGANFADEKYHNLGVGMDAEEPDLGRFVVTQVEKDKGAFKTPTVRNVEFSAPYMHDGSQKTLEEVVDWYAKGGHANEWLSEKVKKFEATDQDKQDLVAFMKALSGPFPNVETGRLPE